MAITLKKKIKMCSVAPLEHPGPAPSPEPEAPNVALEELMTIPEVMKVAKVSDSTVRRWIRSDGLRVYRVGSQIRIARADLVRFIQRSSE